MNAEAAARAKRQRRRANEVKTRTIQRMQLRMTAPMDIGLEQADPALGGHDDMFDLDQGSRALRGRVDDDSDSDEDEGEDDDAEDEALDSEEERERKVAGLEAELDGMYDAYQEHLRERDAKYKVKESLKNNKAREAWHGIGQGGSDEDSDVEDGGYEKVMRAKARIGERDSDSSDDSSDEENEAETAPVGGKKRRRADVAESGSKSKKARTAAKLEEPKAALSRSAQIWFDQDMFAGLDAEVEDEEDDEEVMESSEEEEEEVVEEVNEVRFLFSFKSSTIC